MIQSLISGQWNDGIWEYPPDVWSLGCLIFEIVTAVPIWMPTRCSIELKTTKKGLIGL